MNMWKPKFKKYNTIYNLSKENEIGTHSTKYMQNLYVESYRILMKKMKKTK